MPIFKSVSDSIGSYVFFWIWMFSLLAVTNLDTFQNQYGAINPFILFSLWFLASVIITVNEAGFENIKQAYGFDVKTPGFGTLATINGIGTGLLIYGFFTGFIWSVAENTTLASVANPFYNPVTASATSFSLEAFSLAAAGGIMVFHAYVAFSEESSKIVLFKVGANWLRKKFGININLAMVVSLYVTFTLWGVWHFFSWEGLTVASIMLSVMYGTFFLAGYVVLGVTDILPPGRIENTEITETLSGVIIYNPIAAHWTFNVLVSVSGFGLALSTIGISGAAIFILSTAAMFAGRVIYG